MESLDLRNKLLNIITNADENYLKRIGDFVERSNFEDNYVVSDAHKVILDQRLAIHLKNPTSGKDWSDLRSELSAKYGL